MAISLVSFSFYRAAQPEARGHSFLLSAGFLYHILSPTGLVSKTGLYRILSPTRLVSKLTDFLSTPSYIIVQSFNQYLWNGMFDRHQAEISVMQFTGHSLPVHPSMTVPQDFTLYHIVSQTHPRQCNMQLPRLWNGIFGWVEGQYTTMSSLFND